MNNVIGIDLEIIVFLFMDFPLIIKKGFILC